MVADHFLDRETEKSLREIDIELRCVCKLVQPGNLLSLAGEIGRQLSLYKENCPPFHCLTTGVHSTSLTPVLLFVALSCYRSICRRPALSRISTEPIWAYCTPEKPKLDEQPQAPNERYEED